MDHSYGFIAMAALSHMTTLSVDGYSGRAAWDFMKAHKPNQNLFATESPKWALLPLGDQAAFPSAVGSGGELERKDELPRAAAKREEKAAGATISAEKKEAAGSNPAVSAPKANSEGVGWHELPNTKLGSVCPSNNPEYAFGSNCMNVIAAWSGGIADDARNRLIIWGGGHNDYYGNELYALDLNRSVLTRLNDPSPLNPGPAPLPCTPALPDGKPNTRHTYGGLSYIAHADRMYAFGGIVACTNGGGSNDTWTLNLATLQWTRMDPHKGTEPRTINGVSMSDYDPNTKLVFMENTRDFYSYDFDKNTYARLQYDTREISYHMSAVIDPKRKLFILFGGEWDGNGGIKVINIAPHSNYQIQDWNAHVKGCEKLRNVAYPGLAYDPVQSLIVGWGGGDAVYLFDPDAKTCKTVSYPNGPGDGQHNGTHGRFRYFPKLDVFALVNDVNENAYTLRLRLPAAAAAH
jgi:hypothetical protein